MGSEPEQPPSRETEYPVENVFVDSSDTILLQADAEWIPNRRRGQKRPVYVCRLPNSGANIPPGADLKSAVYGNRAAGAGGQQRAGLIATGTLRCAGENVREWLAGG